MALAPAQPALFPGSFELSVSLVPDLLLPFSEHVGRRDVADGAVKADVVVVMGKLPERLSGLAGLLGLKASQDVTLDGAMPTFHLAVGLWIVGLKEE